MKRNIRKQQPIYGKAIGSLFNELKVLPFDAEVTLSETFIRLEYKNIIGNHFVFQTEPTNPLGIIIMLEHFSVLSMENSPETRGRCYHSASARLIKKISKLYLLFKSLSDYLIKMFNKS